MSSKISRIWIDLKKIERKIKKIKTSLWKKTSKKNKQNINSSHIHASNVNTEILANNKFSFEASKYSIEDLHKLNYICFVFLKVIYLHYETNKVDFCIQSIQNNPILEYIFRLSYNEFRTKFIILQTISNDQGENLALELSRSAKFFSILTHLFELLPPPFSAVGGVMRLGISEVNKKNKVLESKNILKYCNTYENFTKIISLLFSCILVKNLTDIEDLDALVEKNFSFFWKILNAQAEQSQEKSSFPENIEKFWASCFCLFASTVFCNSKLNATNAVESKQKTSITNVDQLCGTKFFDIKKLPSATMLPLLTMNNISKFWGNNAQHVPIPEIKPRISPRLITSN
ncbi:MAG: hypothetical protein WA659_04445 [Candidatus Aquirickettsiella sp.]